MNVTIFGSGYVGLVTGACLAHVGHQVTCVDIDAERVNGLNRGESPIYEPGLDNYLASGLSEKHLSFTTKAAPAVANADVIFIAVGTPTSHDGSADTRYVLNVAKTIGQHLQKASLVVTKSTVPVGTADRVREVIAEALAYRDLPMDFHVASNPEFLKEGSAIQDFMKPDRIIVGADSPAVEDKFRILYAAFNRNHDRLMVMDVRSAELAKYAANAMLATKISFINEVANIAERVGADVEAVRKGMGADPRIGYHFIYPGCGYGGSCFPKDVRALAATALEHGYEPQILPAVESVNVSQKQRLFTKLSAAMDYDLAGKTIAVWGLAFKPQTDDMREAPSIGLLQSLLAAGAFVQAFDPKAMSACEALFEGAEGLSFAESKEAAVCGADALVICTEWKSFWSPDFSVLRRSMTGRLLIDGRNLYDTRQMAAEGFHYISVGRPAVLGRKDAYQHDLRFAQVS